MLDFTGGRTESHLVHQFKSTSATYIQFYIIIYSHFGVFGSDLRASPVSALRLIRRLLLLRPASLLHLAHVALQTRERLLEGGETIWA
jgi:hypothetical protein